MLTVQGDTTMPENQCVELLTYGAETWTLTKETLHRVGNA